MEELQAALKEAFKEDVTLQEATEFMRSVDTNGDGTLSFDGFTKLVNKQY